MAKTSIVDEILALELPSDAEIKEETHRFRLSESLRGQTLEQILGPERAQAGRQARAKAASHPRDVKTVEKILATKRAKGVYESSTHGMRGKEHKEDTKIKQSTKAQVRQDLKKRLGLGRNDSIPKDVLLAEYKRLKL